jgi:orotate phosphoribosyltransferase
MLLYAHVTNTLEEDMTNHRDMLARAGCILEGEFFFALKTRGKVSKKYINIDPVFTDPAAVRHFGHALTFPFAGKFSCIVGPAIGGIPLLYAAAFASIHGLDMTQKAHLISTAFAEKDGDGFVFNRMGFEKAVKGQRVLVVEDISSTGLTEATSLHPSSEYRICRRW